MDDTKGSTIARMIHRFRTSEPTDRKTRNLDTRQASEDEKGFWWTSAAAAKASKHSKPLLDTGLMSDDDDDDDDNKSVGGDYVWQQPSPLSRTRPGEGFRGVETLDDLIARDVEELAAARLSLDATGRESRRSPRRGRGERRLSDQSASRERIAEFHLLSDGDDSESEDDSDVNVESDVEDDDDEVIVHETNSDGSSSKSSSPRKVRVALEDPMAAQSMRDAINAARRKMKDLEEIMSHERSEDATLQKSSDVFLVLPDNSSSSHTTAAEIGSNLEAAMYAFRLTSDAMQEGSQGSADSPAMELNFDQIAVVEPQDTPTQSPLLEKKEEILAESIDEVIENAQTITRRARETVARFNSKTNGDNKELRPWVTLRELAAERPTPYPREFRNAIHSVDKDDVDAQDHEDILHILERNSHPKGGSGEAKSRPYSSDHNVDAYGREVDPRVSLAEDLDLTLARLKKRLYTNDKKESEAAQAARRRAYATHGEKPEDDLQSMKKEVMAKLAAQLRAGDHDLPPLPSDVDESIDMLTARMRLANDFNRDPARLRMWRGQNIDPYTLDSAQAALKNAFDARDWNEDGLITVDDGRRILEDFARWSGQPLVLTDEHVLKACGLLELSSQYLNFADLLKAFDVFVPPPPSKRSTSSMHESVSFSQVHTAGANQEYAQPRSTSPNPAREDLRHDSRRTVGYESDDEVSEVSSVSVKVGPHELRALAARLRRAQDIIDGDMDAFSANSKTSGNSSKAEVRPVRLSPGWEEKQQHAFNPERYNVPSAPRAPPQAAFKVPQGQFLMDLSALHTAVQDATIEFYKKKLDTNEVRGMRRRRRVQQQRRQRLVQKVAAVTPTESCDTSEDSSSSSEFEESDGAESVEQAVPGNCRSGHVRIRAQQGRSPSVQLMYDGDGVGGGRLRIRSAASRESDFPLDLDVPRPELTTPEQLFTRKRVAASNHFDTHRHRLRTARAQLAEFETLRKRHSQQVSLSAAV